MRLSILAFLFLIVTGLQSWSLTFDETDPMLVTPELQPYTWSAGQNGQLILNLELPTGYHAYEDKFNIQILEPDGFKYAKFTLTNTKEWFDKFSKKTRRGVEKKSQLILKIEAPLRFNKAYEKMKFDFTYQACSDSFCLFPKTKTIEIPIQLAGISTGSSRESSPTFNNAAPSEEKSDSFFSIDQFNKWIGKNWGLAFLFVFFAGILTSFTPCIFPMIPITLAILAKDSEKRTRAQNFLLSVFYVHGIALTYSVLGVAAAKSGSLFGSSLGNPIILSIICIVFFIMSLSMYGLFEIQVPALIRNKFGNGSRRTGYVGALLSGLFAGIVASPCVGPVLVGILAYVATQKNPVLGFFLLFTYAMGLGLIFLILGAFTEFTRKLPRSGPWMETVKFILGSLMLGAFYYYLNLLIPERWHDGFLGVGLIVLASMAGSFQMAKGSHPLVKIKKGFLQAILFIGFIYLAISVFDLRPILYGPHSTSIAAKNQSQWKTYSDQELEMALQSNKPIIIDFFAEWCVACHELEEKTFSHGSVADQLTQFVLLRFDATKDSEKLQQLKAKYKIQGLPTVLFYSSKGEWLESLNLTQFEDANKFKERLNKILTQ